MRQDRTSGRGGLTDPDPLVIDLLIGLAATAIAGAVKKVGQAILAKRQHQPLFEGSEPMDHQIGLLRRGLTELDKRIDQALALMPPGTRRELGGQLLLDQQSIQQYHGLREELLGQVRIVDELLESLAPENFPQRARTSGRPPRLPSDFRDQLRFVERKLRAARTASLADEALLEIRSAAAEMARMLDYIESAE